MGSFIKYLIYIALIVAAFFILKGLWDGELKKETPTTLETNQASAPMTNTPQDSAK